MSLFASERSERVFSNASKGYSECPSVRHHPYLRGNRLGIDKFESFFASFEESKHTIVYVM